MTATNLADLYNAPLIEWNRVAAVLDAGITQAPDTGGPNRHTCWLATINADGSPHVTGIGAMWIDGGFWFTSGDGARKAHNLARDPRCTLSVATHEFDVVIDGDAEKLTNPADVKKLVDVLAADGWPCEVDDSGVAITAPYNAPSAGPPPYFGYRIHTRAATALLTVEPGGATRWDFSPAS